MPHDYLMALVALFYRATLLDYSERTALISKRIYLDQEDGRLKPDNVRRANDLRAQFLYCTNYWHFKELANKDEEQQHFEMQCREYRIDAMVREVENEVESLNASLQSESATLAAKVKELESALQAAKEQAVDASAFASLSGELSAAQAKSAALEERLVTLEKTVTAPAPVIEVGAAPAGETETLQRFLKLQAAISDGRAYTSELSEVATLPELAPLLPKLESLHSARIATDREFQWWSEDVAQFRAERAKKYVSLNEAERRAERDREDAKRKSRQEQRKALGLAIDPLADDSMDDGLASSERDIAQDAAREKLAEQRPDPLLRESAAILGDAVQLLNADGKLSAQVLPTANQPGHWAD